MKQLIFLFIFLSYFNDLSGQLAAIINDKDGYTNVRKEPNIQSKVIYSLQENEVFFINEDKYEAYKDWVEIFVSKSKFAVTANNSMYFKGYIHKSRFHSFNGLATYSNKKNNYEEGFSFAYQLVPFFKKNKIIEYSDSNWGLLINGRPVWGRDGEIPRVEIADIEIEIDGNRVIVPKVLMADIYECSNNFTVYKIEDTYFVQQWNSDGAGGYELIWVITKEGIQQRFIGAY